MTSVKDNSAEALREQVIASLRTVFDPELPVNIYELGLIYDLKATEDGVVDVRMTLTSPNCPVADSLVQQVRSTVAAVAGVNSANVELVFEPPWTPERMSDVAKLELELRGIPDLTNLHKKDRFTGVTINRNRKSG